MSAEFKKILQSDSEIFLNVEEFGEVINLDGLEFKAQLSIKTAEHSGGSTKNYAGLYGDIVELHFKTQEYLEVRRLPNQGEQVTLNGKKYYVRSSIDYLGIAKLELESYRQGQVR